MLNSKFDDAYVLFQRFNSNLLQKKPVGEGSKQTKYCALATGSRDCALAVWCTAKKRPIVVINNIFLKSVSVLLQ